jgi:threonine synthase
LAAREGVFVEPASAASVAGLLQSHENGGLDPGQLVVCTVTGNGLKDIETALSGITISTTTVPADVAAAAAALGL